MHEVCKRQAPVNLCVASVPRAPLNEDWSPASGASFAKKIRSFWTGGVLNARERTRAPADKRLTLGTRVARPPQPLILFTDIESPAAHSDLGAKECMEASSTHRCLCGREFPEARAYSVHTSRCRKRTEILQDLAQKRKLREAEEGAAKLRREQEEALQQERARLREVEAEVTFAPVDDIQQPQSSSGRPQRARRLPRALRDFLPSNLRSVPVSMRPPPPSPPTIVDAPPSPLDHIEEPDSPQMPSEHLPVRTEANDFGLYRIYTNTPSRDPEADCSIQEFCDSAAFALPRPSSRPWWQIFGSDAIRSAANATFVPFLNATTFRLMAWFYSGSSMKSLGELDRLVQDVLLQDDFRVDDLRGFSAARELTRLDDWIDEDSEDGPFKARDGWHHASVPIQVPCERVSHKGEQYAPTYHVPGVFHRRLCPVMRAACASDAALQYHLTPFELRHQTPHGPATTSPTTPPSQRVYSELYNSKAMNAAYDEVCQMVDASNAPRPRLEIVVIAIMIWSDSTHLASFGTASLWPIYVYIGNQSKYMRGKPSAFAGHHLAYIPSLPDTFQDWYREKFGKSATNNVLKHCKRELMQAIWYLLLDDDFVHAYHDGMVTHFADGVMRLAFPRIFTYSADYPEKILLATIRFLATRPCPRCYILKMRIPDMGTYHDMQRRAHEHKDNVTRRTSIELVRRLIFVKGRSITSQFVEATLQEWSWTPTRNAFSERLGSSGFDFHRMLVPDLLHEFELGVFKSTFTHLLRILYAAGGNAIQDLNIRYRQTPTFGRDTIRRFVRNTSAMKKLAARDFENILQCAIPVFDRLLPEPHNSIVLDLLFVLASWHALAKLRIHTDATLQALRDNTEALGAAMRKFKTEVCSQFLTKELPREEAARGRRTAALATRGGRTGHQSGRGRGRGRGRGQASHTSSSDPTGMVSQSTTDAAQGGPPTGPAGFSGAVKGPKIKELNLKTYKYHALADYPATIEWFGTSDNYSTQIGEAEHKRVKRFYGRTNKGISFVGQITKHQRREEKLRLIHSRHAKAAAELEQEHTPASLPFDAHDPLGPTVPEEHHHVSRCARFSEDLTSWLRNTSDDHAFTNWDFLARLQDHILARLEGQTRGADGEERQFSTEARSRVRFYRNRLYKHKALRVNYTTYDCRRTQDSLNPRTHADVMVLSHEDGATQARLPGRFQSYWYARILGVFHVMVQLLDSRGILSQPTRVDFLWVRWFGEDPEATCGWGAKRLPEIGFVPSTDPEAFGFLDPADVIRAVHLIPVFEEGTTDDLLPGRSIVRCTSESEDYRNFYVNIFVDRDMYMRFRGDGIGHGGLLEAHAMRTVTTTSGAVEADENADTDTESEVPQGASEKTLSALDDGMGLDVAPDESDDEVSDDEDDEDGEEEYEYGSDEHEDDEEDTQDSDADGDLGPEDGEDADDDMDAVDRDATL